MKKLFFAAILSGICMVSASAQKPSTKSKVHHNKEIKAKHVHTVKLKHHDNVGAERKRINDKYRLLREEAKHNTTLTEAQRKERMKTISTEHKTEMKAYSAGVKGKKG